MLGYYINVALRNTRQSAMLTALMVLAVSVGVGASMTTLTVMHLLSNDPLPDHSDRIFYPQVDADPDSKSGPYDMLDYRTAVDLWSAHRADRQALVVDSPIKLQGSDTSAPPMIGTMLSTTADFFAMFKVPFRYGAGWSADEDERHARVAVISSELNDKLFAGQNSVGRTLRLRDSDVRIVGVLAPWRPSPLFYDVRGGRYANGDTADFYAKPEGVFIPFHTGIDINDGNFQQFTCWKVPERPGYLKDSSCVWIALWVELNDAAKVSAYRQYLASYAKEQKSLGRFARADNTSLRTLLQWLDYNGVVPSDVKLQTVLSFAFLIICLSNMMGLLLAKFARRNGEIGLRRALGATRSAVFMQCLVEAGVIGALGGAGGLLLTQAGLTLIRHEPIPYADFVHLDIPMFLLTFALSITASLVAGMLPALRASLIQPALQLKIL